MDARGATDPWADQDRQYDSLGPVRLAGTLPKTWSPAPLPPRRPKVSPTTAALIGELSTRFPVSRDADPAEHEARLQLLAEDCSDIDPRYLRAAVSATAKVSEFLPTAAKLRKAAYDAEDSGRGEDARIEANQQRIHAANEELARGGHSYRWRAKGSGPWDMYQPENKAVDTNYDKSTWRVQPRDVEAMNRLYRTAGFGLRYLDSGAADPASL